MRSEYTLARPTPQNRPEKRYWARPFREYFIRGAPYTIAAPFGAAIAPSSSLKTRNRSSPLTTCDCTQGRTGTWACLLDHLPNRET